MLSLWYEAGNEHNPSDPFGRVTMDLAADGSVRVDHVGRGGVARSWTARVGPEVLARLHTALTDAGFPVEPPLAPLLPGTRLRTLRATGDLDGVVLLAWEPSADRPGYDTAFAVLDALVAEIAGVEVDRAGRAPVATDVVPVDRPR
jgi:hypothetical protein